MSIIRTTLIAAASVLAFAGTAQAQSSTTTQSDRERGVPGVEVDVGRNAGGAVDVDVGRNAGSSAQGVDETRGMDRSTRSMDADRSDTRAARADRN
jgi:predicted TIM-barrel enzyme